MGRDGVVVEPAGPFGVHHEDLALRVSHSDAVRVASGAAADTDDLFDALGEEHSGGETLHAAHAGADGGVQLLNSQRVQETELCAHHVVYRQDGESGGVSLSIGGVDGRGPGAAVAASDDIRTDDEVLVCI